MTENEAKSIDDCLKELKGHRSEYLKRSTPWRIINRAVHLIEQLQALKDAEEQGLLLRLPCKVGDNVYKIWNCGKNGKSVAEFRISHIDIDDLQNIEFAFISTKNVSTSYWFCKIGDFGKTVFLTKEEAEQALAKMQGT